MRRSTCWPSGTSEVAVWAAAAPEIRTERPSGRHSPSSRLTRLTAGPMAVNSSRSAAPILPHNISPRCSAPIDLVKRRLSGASRARRLVEGVSATRRSVLAAHAVMASS